MFKAGEKVRDLSEKLEYAHFHVSLSLAFLFSL